MKTNYPEAITAPYWEIMKSNVFRTNGKPIDLPDALARLGNAINETDTSGDEYDFICGVALFPAARNSECRFDMTGSTAAGKENLHKELLLTCGRNDALILSRHPYLEALPLPRSLKRRWWLRGQIRHKTPMEV